MRGKRIRTHDLNCHLTTIIVHEPLDYRGLVGWQENNYSINSINTNPIKEANQFRNSAFKTLIQNDKEYYVV